MAKIEAQRILADFYTDYFSNNSHNVTVIIYAIYIHVSMQITNEESQEEFNALAGVWGNKEFKSVNKTAYSKKLS